MLSPATMTAAGLVLGTAAYMAPEQARGKPVDHRADIWAFGCVLYEMLAGRRSVEGEEITDTLAAILRGEPDWTALPASTPRSIERLVRRCLVKDPRQRLQAIGDARIEIQEAMGGGEGSVAAPLAAAARAPIAPIAVAILLTALAVGGATWMLKPAPTSIDRGVTRAVLAVQPFNQSPRAPGVYPSGVLRTSRNAIALSPDGRTLVLRAHDNGIWHLYVRRLDSLTATPVSGTSGADNPFFSHDGTWIGYADGGELRRVPAAGGASSYTGIARLPNGATRLWGASWGEDDVIVFSTADALWRVAASGGTPEQIVKTREDEFIRVLPFVMPGAKWLLFTAQESVSSWEDARTVVRSLETGEERVLLSDAMDARYAPSGHLVFMRRGRLMAAPFDLERLQVTGAAVAVVDDVMQSINVGNTGEETGAGQYAFAAGGTLAYVTGGVPPDQAREFVWIRRDGTVEVIPAPAREYIAPRVSPDGQRILASTQASDREGGFRLWAYDLLRRTSTPLTASGERATWGVWSPDGTRVGFQHVLTGGRAAMLVTPASGPGTSEPMASAPQAAPVPVSWTRDGLVAFVDSAEATGNDVWVLDTRTGQAHPAIQTRAQEYLAVLSADGRWLAYTSDEAGRPDVYVQPYPGPGPRVLVSPTGGFAPTWRGDGSELFYYTNTNGVLGMYAVAVVATGTGVSTGVPRLLFQGRYVSTSPGRGYDVTADGQRFVMLREVDRQVSRDPPQMILVENWFDELRRLAPAR
jgi:serine/threonine-protein kinase